MTAREVVLIKALERIATPLDCGCRPCRGSCRSVEALQIELDGRMDIARAAIAFRPTWEDCSEHVWAESLNDNDIGGDRTMVECTVCGVPGERDDLSGDVYWPAT